MKRIGPELKLPKKMSDLKAPTFLADIYYDLRERRLLPLVALVVVAIAAIPFLLGHSEELPESALPIEAGGVEAESDVANFTVVEATPGLRDPRKRLKGRTPTDPFAQSLATPPGGSGGSGEGGSGGDASSGGGSSSSAATVEVEETEVDEVIDDTPAPGGGGGSAPGNPGSLDPTEPGLRFFSFRPDVRFGVAGSGDLILHEDLEVGRVLPKENPVIVFVGVSEDGKRAAFDVAHEVTAVRGEGHCIGGKQNCSLLMLRSGEAANLLTATPGREFRLKVEEIEFIEVERPDPVKRKPAGASRAAQGSGSFTPAVVGQFDSGAAESGGKP